MVSVEFAHFLGEEKPSLYHEKSYKEFLKINNSEGVIFLDDYNFKVKNFNNPYGVPVVKESHMVDYTDQLLDFLKLKNNKSDSWTE